MDPRQNKSSLIWIYIVCKYGLSNFISRGDSRQQLLEMACNGLNEVISIKVNDNITEEMLPG